MAKLPQHRLGLVKNRGEYAIGQTMRVGRKGSGNAAETGAGSGIIILAAAPDRTQGVHTTEAYRMFLC